MKKRLYGRPLSFQYCLKILKVIKFDDVIVEGVKQKLEKLISIDECYY